MNIQTSNSIRQTLYILTLVIEIIFLYYGFSFWLLGYIQFLHRIIGASIFFPLAIVCSLMSGFLEIKGMPPEIRSTAKLIRTTPVLIMFGVLGVTIVFTFLSFTGQL